MRKVLRLGTVVLIGLVSAGCASILKGSSQTISISSNVEGAVLSLDGVEIGKTPFTGIVPKNKSTLTLRLDGYRTETVTLAKSLEPMFWGNIIIGGTIGSLTDFATGAAYQYAPATYQVDLQAVDQSDGEFMSLVVLRKFSMVYVDEISLDVSAGGGDYLSALLSLLNNDETAPVEIDQIGRALSVSKGDPVRFGQLIVDGV